MKFFILATMACGLVGCASQKQPEQPPVIVPIPPAAPVRMATPEEQEREHENYKNRVLVQESMDKQDRAIAAIERLAARCR